MPKRDPQTEIDWKDEPEEHDYIAARNYLELHFDAYKASNICEQLRNKKHKTVRFKAKDILRASGLALLPANNPYVERHLVKITAGEQMNPVLLVRGIPLLIVDGYHRTCAAYWMDENTEVAARVA